MQKKPFQSLFIVLLVVGFVGSFGCKKTEDVQIACSLVSVQADAAVINSTLTPAKSGVGVQLSIYRNDSLVDKINRTHNGNTNFNIPGLKANTDYKVVINLINDPTIVAQPCTTSLMTTLSNIPVVVTAPATGLTSAGADVGGAVIFDGLRPVLESGICWSLSANPTYASNHIGLGTGISNFTYTFTTLNPNTTYHVRAFARTAAYLFYGDDIAFTTLALTPMPPTVTTTTPTGVSQNGVSTGGNVTSEGTAPVTVRGICWATTVNPDITGNKTTNGSGPGSFVTNLNSLLPGTTYHVRAYATNSVGTSYGADELVITSPVVAPTVTTNNPANITQTSANAGGNVTSSGGATVTALGVCYGTTANPDLTGTFTNNGSGTGGYTSPLTGLTPGTLYHVRAYATNSIGTSYGADLTFTTLP